MEGEVSEEIKGIAESRIEEQNSRNFKARSLGQEAWRKFRKNKLAMFGLCMILFAVLIATLGANIRPDDTVDAQTVISEIAQQKPGFEVDVLRIRQSMDIQEEGFFGKMFFGGNEPGLFRYEPVVDHEIKGDSLYFSVFNSNPDAPAKWESIHLLDVLYPLDHQVPIVNEGDTYAFTDFQGQKQQVSKAEVLEEVPDMIEARTFWLGTDANGRDVLSRLMAGTIISLLVGLVSVFIALILGISLGALAGFFRGWVDSVIMWVINVVWSIPALLLVISFTLAFGRDFVTVFVGVGCIFWVDIARLVRGEVMSVRQREYVLAGRALGFSKRRIIVHHILPNITSPIIVVAAASFAAAILIEAGLSFLGVGTQPPTPSWGAMINNYKQYIDTEYMFLPILPGLCIVLMVLAFMLVGNGVRDAIDTRASAEENMPAAV